MISKDITKDIVKIAIALCTDTIPIIRIYFDINMNEMTDILIYRVIPSL